jgi:hypothetical protein
MANEIPNIPVDMRKVFRRLRRWHSWQLSSVLWLYSVPLGRPVLSGSGLGLRIEHAWN